MSIGNNDPSAVAIRNLRHVLAQAAFFQERLPPLEASIRTLVAEVEYLRGERAAVVAWLQAEAQRMYEAGQDRPAWFTLSNRAERIERGEHRSEEGA